MPSISDVISDELTGHSVDLLRVEAGVAKKILGQLKALEQELVQKIGSIDTESVSGSYKLNRLEKLKEQTSSSIKNFYKKNRKILNDDLIELSSVEEKYSRQSLNGAFKVEIASTAVPIQTLKQLVKGSLIQGSPASEWWSRQAKGLQDRFSDQMTLGVLQGETNGQLVQRVRGTATGKFVTYEIDGVKRKYREFAGGLMDVPTHQAKALVRTSVQNVANLARMETYKENSDVISKIQVLASLDNRTTPICMARSGLVWELETETPVGHDEPFPGPPPWHYNCRSTLLPITKTFKELAEESGKKLKKKVGEIPPSTQASMDGQVAKTLNYHSWLKKKPKAFQKQVLGKEKYEMFRKGDLNLRDLIDHQTGRSLSLAELRMKIEGPSDVVEKSVKKLASLKPIKAKNIFGSDIDEKIEDMLDEDNVTIARNLTKRGTAPERLAKKLAEKTAESKDLQQFFKVLSDDLLQSTEASKWDDLLRKLDGKGMAALKRQVTDTTEELFFEWVWDIYEEGPMVFQFALKSEFGLAATTSHMELHSSYKKIKKLFAKDKAFAKGAKEFVRLVYEESQLVLTERGMDSFLLYRGANYVRVPNALEKAAAGRSLKRGAVFDVEVESQPLSSWTTSPEQALDFMHNSSEKGASQLLIAEVPKERLFAWPADLKDVGEVGEMLVLGGKDKITTYLARSIEDTKMEDILNRVLTGKGDG